jgi:glycosyltransferase involved in cell wall biosynthesis
MVEPMNIKKKPYTVIEGMIPNSRNVSSYQAIKAEQPTKGNKVILYTGSLLAEFGIEKLLEAFMKIKDESYELWICGPLTESKIVSLYCKKDTRIKYLGFLQKDDVIKAQQMATVLVNPRPNIGEYVKYSFPSKTMEYLLSGKPIIMFKLDGLPEDYFDFIYFFKEYNCDSIAKTIIDVCSKSEVELDQFGLKAQAFVLGYKNNLIQTKKAIDLVEQI